VPFAAIYAQGWEQVRFDIVGYHLTRVVDPNFDSLSQKKATLWALIGFDPVDRWLGIQLLVLLVLALPAIALFSRARGALVMLLLLVSSSVLPRPTYVQYFCVALPFLVELAVLGVFCSVERALCGRYTRGLLVAAGGAYSILAGLELHRHVVTGDRLVGIETRAAADALSIPAVRRVARYLNASSQRGTIASTWPGYLLETDAHAWPGLENHFGIVAGRVLRRPEQRRLYRILSAEDVDSLAKAGLPALWVVAPRATPQDHARLAISYQLLDVVAGAAVYRRRAH
jgi:hypothetical protein